MVPVHVRDQLDQAVADLERHGPTVARALLALGQTTHAAWLATLGVRCDAELVGIDWDTLPDHSDAEWERLEAVTGIARGWKLADQVRNAHPDYADGVR
jgi:hypothetical protein